MKTVKPGDFRIATCQATLYTPELELSVAPAMRDLFPKWFEKLDGEPTVVPPAAGMPRDLVRIILGSKDGALRCEASPNRINFFWGRRSIEASDPDITEYFSSAQALLAQYAAFFKARVGRVAALVSRFAAHESPALLLADHFCKPEWLRAPLNRPENFELHAHKRFALSKKFFVNSWVRCKTGRTSERKGEGSCVLVEQDLNTLLEEPSSRSFGPEDTKEFFGLAAKELDIILKLYFPEVSGSE